MIDNGVLWDQVWLFGSSLADELSLKPDEEAIIGGSGEGDPTQAYLAGNLILKFQDIEFYDQPVVVSPASAGFAQMFPGTDGQLCNTFFKHFIVEFDFVKQEILLHDPKCFKYKGNGSILDMQANETGSYSVPFSFIIYDGKEYNDRIDIDLGGIYPLIIALHNKNNIQLPPEAKSISNNGAQGKSTEFVGKIQSMTIGKYMFEHPTAIFGDEKTTRVNPDNLGIIDLPLFMKFNTIFDYFNYKLYIEANAQFNNAFSEK